MSELVYTYVEQIYSQIRRQSMNFSNKFNVSYKGEKLKIHRKMDSLPENFWGKKISNISLIIGKNGIGKSSLLDLISFGPKNRKKLLPRVQFFQIFHVENQLFYFEGSEALKKKIFGNNAPSKNTFFFETISNNVFEIQDRTERFILDINYQKLSPRISWIDVNNPTNENDKRISRQLSNSLSANDILDFLPSQKSAFNSENMTIKIKQKGRYSRASADILYYVYHGEYSDLQDKEGNFSNISKRINTRLNLIENQVYFNRKNQDKKYGFYKKKYFVLRLLEKEVINEMQKKENSKKRIKILEQISSTRKRSGFSIKLREFYEEQEFYVGEELDQKIDFLFKLLNDLQKGNYLNPRKYTAYDELISLLLEVEDTFFDTFNSLSFSLLKVTHSRSNLIKQLSDEYQMMFKMKFSNLSDGEMVYVNTFAQIAKAVTSSRQLLLVLDEPDLNLHPEWSRLFVQKLVTLIEENSNCNVQVIMSSHSPFLVTDFPKENVFFVSEGNKNKEKNIQNAKKSFAGNLYDVALDSFFLDFPMGEFVRRKLNALKEHTHQEQVEIVDLVDDTMLKNILIDSYELTELEKKGKYHD